MSHHGAPNKIRLRLTIPPDVGDDHANDDVMSMSMSADDGQDGAADATMLSPPSSTTSSFRRTPASGVATPTSTRNHKRPRVSNDWVEDEVHPSLVGHGFSMGGGESKRVMTTALAALSAQLSGDSGSLGHDDGGTPQQHVLHASSDVHNLMTMMMPTSSSPSPTLRRALSSTAPTTMQLEFEHHHHHHHHHAQAASFMSPSSPSDPSPLMDLRKAALLRSRFMKDDASLANVSLLHSSSTRPPAGVEAATSATSTERREQDGKRKTDRDPSATRDTGEERKRPTEDDTVVDTNSIPSLLL